MAKKCKYSNTTSKFIIFDFYSSFDLETGWVVAAHRVTSETYTIHNLKPDTSYVFLVRAENSDGLSHPSPVSERVRTLRLISSEFVHEDDHPIDLAEVQNTLLSKVVELSTVEAIRYVWFQIRF